MMAVAWRRKLKHGWEYRNSAPTSQTRGTGWMPLYSENTDDAHKAGWNEAVEAAADLMEIGAGVDAETIREQLESA